MNFILSTVPKGYVSNRGKIPISHELSERPVEANERSRFGDWEADTIVGYNRKFLSRLGSKEVESAIKALLKDQPLHTITPDRGREFQLHGQVTAALGAEFYFPPPHQPWQRGTNENTNGLLREYYRPRKCLGYRTPAEVYFSTMLHLT